MKHQRNVEGLRENALKKKQEARIRTEEGIQKLIRDGRVVNFKTVSEVANVSTAWLYKELDIKERIEHLRAQGSRNKKVSSPQHKASDASKEAKYQALKHRLQKVEAENRGLKEHLEAIHGRHRVLADENEKKRREIEHLTKLLNEATAEIKTLKSHSIIKEQINVSPMSSSDSQSILQEREVTPIDKRKKTISDRIQSELDRLRIELNSTLTCIIKTADEQTVLNAIAALEENMKTRKVGNPGGFLHDAIKERWIKSDPPQQQLSQRQPEIYTASPEPEEDLVPPDQLKKLFGQTDE